MHVRKWNFFFEKEKKILHPSFLFVNFFHYIYFTSFFSIYIYKDIHFFIYLFFAKRKKNSFSKKKKKCIPTGFLLLSFSSDVDFLKDQRNAILHCAGQWCLFYYFYLACTSQIEKVETPQTYKYVYVFKV